jgi:hypothetical protein
MRRSSLWDHIEEMKKISVPTLVVTGDEDDRCLEPALLMKRSIQGSGLMMSPRTEVMPSIWRTLKHSIAWAAIFCTRSSWGGGDVRCNA